MADTAARSTQVLASETVGSGPRVVLVHGFTQTGRSWRRIADDLACDHEVVCVDAPGHGGSSDVRADLWRGAHLLGQAGGQATYVGYSMGGRLALHLAVERPDLVERLVLLGVHPGLDDDVAKEARRDADEELARSIERDGVAAFLDRWLAQALFTGLPHDQADRADRLRNSAAGLASSLRLAGTGRQESLWHRATTLAMPTLIVAGEHDTKFRALGLRLAEAVGPTASFATVPGAGHAAHLERPSAFVSLVRRWLSATDAH
jgi:2-succinyl-6-hydroxy-2,4-cyclohexadiene-1-carboxylate synthase